MITIDFETRSEVDIVAEGGAKYHIHPSTDILMMGYKINNEPVKVWFPGDKLPEWMNDENETIYAYNSAFELGIWNNVGTKRYGFPELRAERTQDAQALCGRYGLPQRLSEAAKALGVKTQKDSCGKQLIKLFCTPPYGRDSKDNLLPDTQHLWRTFITYNIHDVQATYEVVKALPADRLSKSEHEIWLLNHRINVRGIPVAVDEAAQILRVTMAFLEEHNKRLPELTGGRVTKITQIARIKSWINDRGYPCESLVADELAKWLQRDDLPDDIMEVLEIRAGMGLSSIGKYKRILAEATNGRMLYNSRYYGAHTGRITGMGFQLLNLPRKASKDPESEISGFFNLSVCYGNPVLSARALVRAMVRASPGNVIVAADYSSIEYILLIWLCKEFASVQRFADGLDQYIDLATHIYNTQYSDITPDQRQMGKIGILGCGYGLGAEGFIRYSDKWGVKISLPEATRIVKGFRNKYPNIPKFWYALNNAAIMAIECKGHEFEVNSNTFKVVRDRNKNEWLALKLLSGRTMFYARPAIGQGKFGPEVTTWSMNQTTRQYCKKSMTPGKWAENVIQALGRDLLYYGKMKIENAGYPIIFSVYDEVVAEVPKDKANLDEFCKLMCSCPPWAKGLPLRAEGYIDTRYKKG